MVQLTPLRLIERESHPIPLLECEGSHGRLWRYSLYPSGCHPNVCGILLDSWTHERLVIEQLVDDKWIATEDQKIPSEMLVEMIALMCNVGIEINDR